MPDDRCRITVVGERKSVDLALPAHAPISKYMPRLTDLCGANGSDAIPPVWSLGEPGAAPLSPGDSLAGAGIADGATLYLYDTHADDGFDLVVTDLGEQIAEAQDDNSVWSPRTRAQAVVCIGLLVCVLSAWQLVVQRSVFTMIMALVVFPAVALTAVLVSWYASYKAWPVGVRVRQALALAACPLMACAGLGAPLRGPVATPVLVCVTALVGAAGGIVAQSCVPTVMLTILTGCSGALVVPLVAVGANATESAAVVSTALFMVLGTLPLLPSRIAVLVPGARDVSERNPGSGEVAAMVGRSNRLLAFLSFVAAAAFASCFVFLSFSPDGFALALLGCLSAGLLLQAGSLRLLSAVFPQLTAGGVGLFLLVVRLPEAVLHTHVTGRLIAFLAGLVLVGVGLSLAFGAVTRPSRAVDERPQWPTTTAAFLAVVSLPLAVGVFGVFGTLANLGGGL